MYNSDWRRRRKPNLLIKSQSQITEMNETSFCTKKKLNLLLWLSNISFQIENCHVDMGIRHIPGFVLTRMINHANSNNSCWPALSKETLPNGRPRFNFNLILTFCYCPILNQKISDPGHILRQKTNRFHFRKEGALFWPLCIKWKPPLLEFPPFPHWLGFIRTRTFQGSNF